MERVEVTDAANGALKMAAQRGHAMGRWLQLSWASGSGCRKCNKSVVVIKRGDGNYILGGTAHMHKCPATKVAQ